MFWVAVDCPACGSRVPLNGIAPSARCRCGWSLRTSTSFWRRIIEPAVQRADQLPEGVGAPVRIGGSGGCTVVVIYGRTRARCALCNRQHRLDRLVKATRGDDLGCGHCGALAAVRVAPDWLRLPDAEHTLVVGEAIDGFLEEPLPWYLVRLKSTRSDRPPAPDPDTAPDVFVPPVVQTALSLVLTSAPHEVGVSDQIRPEGGTEEIDIGELEELSHPPFAAATTDQSGVRDSDRPGALEDDDEDEDDPLDTVDTGRLHTGAQRY